MLYLGFKERKESSHFFKTGPNLDKAVGSHVNGPGHKVSDMAVTILEKVRSKDPMVLAGREEFWIRKLNSKYKGINRNRS